MLVKWYATELHACGYVRAEMWAREANQLPNFRIDVKQNISKSDFLKTNIMVFQRAFDPSVLESMKLAKRNGIKVVYEIDDDMLNMPEGFKKPYDFYRQPKIRQTIVDFMGESDAITCSTYELAKRLAIITPKKPIFVIENALDVHSWDKAYSDKQIIKKDHITIGWMASGSHVIDIPIVSDVLEILMEDYKNLSIHFIGWVGFKDAGLAKYENRIIVEDWVPIEYLPHAMSNFDINLCPLQDNIFNRCKSNIKYLQGSALGIPSVCSNLPPYDGIVNGKDGFIADDSASWLACLKELLDNTEARIGIGAIARAKLLEKYDVRNNYIQWVNTFERIMKG